MKRANEVWNLGLNPITMYRVGNGLSRKQREKFMENRKHKQVNPK